MMPASFRGLDGREQQFDLDSVTDFVAGLSARSQWRALVVFVPAHSAFVELRDSPPDVRGHSLSEAEQVTERYLAENYAVTARQIETFKRRPSQWKFIDCRP